VADQHEISRSFGGVGVAGAEANARVIVIDRNAVALCACGRSEKRSREYE
jgi:CDGSH-type Zn-finger protein